MENSKRQILSLFEPLPSEERVIGRNSCGSPYQASSFIVSVRKSPFESAELTSQFKSDWTKKQKRLYHRVLSGFEIAKQLKDRVRVIELGTDQKDQDHDIHRDFTVLVKRIRREFGRFEYMAVKELSPKNKLLHLHIVYRGSYIPQKWLSDQWAELHNAPVVWIAELYSWKYAKHVARYFIKEGVGRFWGSWGWVYRGFCRDWRKMIKRYGQRAISFWKWWLRQGLFREKNSIQTFISPK